MQKKFIDALEVRRVVVAVVATVLFVLLVGDWLLWPAAVIVGAHVFLAFWLAGGKWWVAALLALVAALVAFVVLGLLAWVIGVAMGLVGALLLPALPFVAAFWAYSRLRLVLVCSVGYRAENSKVSERFTFRAADQCDLERKLRKRLAKLTGIALRSLDITDREVLEEAPLPVERLSVKGERGRVGTATVSVGR